MGWAFLVLTVYVFSGMRFFIYLAYNGSNYSGWQRQPNALTVQEVVEDALETILRDEVALTGAGRTDAGVHALDMAAHFDFDGTLDCNMLKRNLNSLLPPDIAVNRIEPVEDEKHARFDAKKRTYQYHIATQKNPFLKGRACFIYYPLDIEKMNRAAAMLIGKKDFQSFSKVHTDVSNFVCEIYKAEWEKRGDELVFTIAANRFLRGMVRAIVGTLVDVGAGRMPVEGIEEILESRDRCKAGQSMDACGLFFVSAEY